MRFLLHTIGIVRYKILQLEVEKYHLILNIGPHVNKYMFQHVSSLIFTKMALKFEGFTSKVLIISLITFARLKSSYECNNFWNFLEIFISVQFLWSFMKNFFFCTRRGPMV